jgi:hypothetical protein
MDAQHFVYRSTCLSGQRRVLNNEMHCYHRSLQVLDMIEKKEMVVLHPSLMSFQKYCIYIMYLEQAHNFSMYCLLPPPGLYVFIRSCTFVYMYVWLSVSTSLLRRHLTRGIGWWEKVWKLENYFFKTHSQAKTHRQACGGGYVSTITQKISNVLVRKFVGLMGQCARTIGNVDETWMRNSPLAPLGPRVLGTWSKM